MKLALTNAKYYTPRGFMTGIIIIEDGLITSILEPNMAVSDSEQIEIISTEGCVILPGLVDPHVHLREPGYTHKETIASGTAAAARGGVTTIFSMPNLNPAPDSPENLAVQERAIQRDAVVRVIPYAAITIGQRGAGTLVDMEALAPSVGGFSDDGRGVQSEELMREAMVRAASVGRPIVAHCEVDDLLFQGYIHDGEYCKANGHRGICSESEWAQVKRDIEMVEQTGVQYHVCHISTKESVELIRQAKAKGLKVSCETAPHYLILTDMDLKEEGRFKMNPPIRSAEDRAALLGGIVDGTIDSIATDHAPHSADEKSRGLAKSAFGVVGIETSFATCYTHLVESGLISIERLVELMSLNARSLFGLPKGEIEVGAVADLAAFCLTERFKIDPSEFVSMGKATPLEGMEVAGRTKLTIVGGEVVYTER
ncbi:MAG: dihydroorotase [Rikenellaceae bacterium]